MSVYLRGRWITPMSVWTLFFSFTSTARVVGLITFTSHLSARLISSIIYHTHFTCFLFPRRKYRHKKWNDCRIVCSQWCRSGHRNERDSWPQLLKCLFYRSLSDISQVQLELILSWLSPDKMKYCKRAVLFVYLAIGGRARYTLFDCEEFAPSVSATAYGKIKSGEHKSKCFIVTQPWWLHVLGTRRNTDARAQFWATCVSSWCQNTSYFPPPVMEIALWRAATWLPCTYCFCVAVWLGLLCLSASPGCKSGRLSWLNGQNSLSSKPNQ